MKIVALARADGWGIVERDEQMLLLKPPYQKETTAQLARAEVEKALVTAGFEPCDMEVHSIGDAVTFLKEQFVAVHRERIGAVDLREAQMETLQHADESTLLRFLHKVREEMLPQAQWNEAMAILTDLLGLPLLQKSAELRQEYELVRLALVEAQKQQSEL